jgi:hypothetical protein
MRTTIVALALAAATLGGCTFNSTTVERARTPAHVAVEPAPAPVVVYQTPPPVVYQAAPTVVYQTQAPVVSAPPAGTVSVTYTGPGGYQLARQKAGSYCAAHYGNSRVDLLSNDEAAGRARFGCYRI